MYSRLSCELLVQTTPRRMNLCRKASSPIQFVTIIEPLISSRARHQSHRQACFSRTETRSLLTHGLRLGTFASPSTALRRCKVMNGTSSPSSLPQRQYSSASHGSWRRAYVALGSNVGDRLEMIEEACLRMRASENIRVVRTSSLYETKPMYVENQDTFLNGACEVRHLATQIQNIQR